VSTGGLAVALAELITEDAGADVAVDDRVSLFDETPGRAVVETTDPESVENAFDGVAPVTRLGTATDEGELSLDIDGESLTIGADRVAALRGVLDEALD
jgi:phosphoribosylformylglycinamidine synthase